MLAVEQRYGLEQGAPNAGHVRDLWLLRASSVLAVLDPTQLPVPGKPMTVNKGGIVVRDIPVSVTRFVLPPQTGTFTETSLTDSDGPVWVPTLSVTVPKPNAALLNYLYRTRGGRWLAFWNDGNGQGWTAGEPDNGLRLTTVQSQAEINALTIVLTGRYCHPTWQLESTNMADLFPDSAFDYSFELSFDS